ncbi:MAG: redoxin domain-containing protein [Leptospiraceae bacterium]|nr:redoxin domain-containing protein [Leptospiraceae bacterium]
MKSFILIFYSFTLILFSFSQCTSKLESNFNVNSFEGVDFTGKLVKLSEIKSPRVVLNVYSPTCIPCFKEIPTLNYLAGEMKKDSLGEIYMVVDPLNVVDGGESLPPGELEKKSIEIMKAEVEKRGIELPVLIMKPPFKVTPGEGLITGTPETLLFKTSPLILYYNFIGSISEKNSLEEIESDSKVKFFKRILGGV